MDRPADHTLSCNPARKHRCRDRTDYNACPDNRDRRNKGRYKGARRTLDCTRRCRDRGMGCTGGRNRDHSNSRRRRHRRIVPLRGTAPGCNGYPCNWWHTQKRSPGRTGSLRDRLDCTASRDRPGRRSNPGRRGVRRKSGCTPHCPDRGMGRTRWSNPDYSNSRRNRFRHNAPLRGTAAGCNGSLYKKRNRTRWHIPARTGPDCSLEPVS